MSGRGGFGSVSAEALEARRLLSVSIAANGVLTIDDSSVTTPLHIVVDTDSSNGDYRVNDTGQVTEFPAAEVDSVQILGGNGANYIELDASFANTLTPDNGINGGGAGADTIISSPTSDCIIFGGTGGDLIECRGGNNIVSGNAGPDTIVGGSGSDTLYGNAGNDSILAGKGNQQLIGGRGADTMKGGPGSDSLYGKNGNDLEYGGSGNAFIRGGMGNNTMIGGGGNDTVIGGPMNSVLVAGHGDFLPVVGQTAPGAYTGSSLLEAGTANDTMIAGGSTDTLMGGSGADDFYSLPGDTLEDFNSAQGDFQPSQNVYTDSAVTTTTITLSININGSPVAIPNGAGSFSGGTSIAEVTSVNGNTATVTFSSDADRSFVLGDFFNQWGISFGAVGIGQYPNTSGGALSMTVNGVAVSTFKNFVVQNGDNIVINYNS